MRVRKANVSTINNLPHPTRSRIGTKVSELHAIAIVTSSKRVTTFSRAQLFPQFSQWPTCKAEVAQWYHQQQKDKIKNNMSDFDLKKERKIQNGFEKVPDIF